MSSEPIVAIEIGTSKVVALVGEMRDDGSVMIIGVGERESTGVRKGEIRDLEKAAHCVRCAVDAADQNSGVNIREVYLAVTGGHIRSTMNHGDLPVLDPDGIIGKEDVDQVGDVAKAVRLADEREIIHTISQNYQVDGQPNIVNPEGMVGGSLGLDILILHGLRKCIRNTIRVVKSIQLEVLNVAFNGCCSALSVLTAEQKQGGVVILDLGAGTTDYVAYAKNIFATAGALGVGGDHLTNDIARAFNIDQLRAEVLKKEHVNVSKRSRETGKALMLEPEVGFTSRNVSLTSLDTVVRVRAEEVFSIIKRELERHEILHHLGAGVVLTGGGSHLKGICELAEDVFGLPAMIGRPRNVSGLSSEIAEPEYATACGLIQHGFKSVDRGGALPLTRWLKGLFSN